MDSSRHESSTENITNIGSDSNEDIVRNHHINSQDRPDILNKCLTLLGFRRTIHKIVLFGLLLCPLSVWLLVTFFVTLHCRIHEGPRCSANKLQELSLYTSTLFGIAVTSVYCWYWAQHYLLPSLDASLALIETINECHESIPIDTSQNNTQRKPGLITKMTQLWAHRNLVNDDTSNITYTQFLVKKNYIGITLIMLNMALFILISIADSIVDCINDPLQTPSVFIIKTLYSNSTVSHTGICCITTFVVDLLLYPYCTLFLSMLSMTIWLMCHCRRYQIKVIERHIKQLEPSHNPTDTSKLIAKYITHNSSYDVLAANVDKYLSICLPLTLLVMMVYVHLFINERSEKFMEWMAKLIQLLKIGTVMLSPWYFGALRGCVKITLSHKRITKALVEKQLNCEDSQKMIIWSNILQAMNCGNVSGYYSMWLGSTVSRRDTKFFLYGTMIGILWILLNNINDFTPR